MPEKIVVVQQSPADVRSLGRAPLGSSIGVKVSGQDEIVFNTVYSGMAAAQSAGFKWTGEFALNFTKQLPDPGQRIAVQGQYQACNINNGLKLNSSQSWESNDNDAQNVPGLNCLNELGDNIYVVVGTMDPDGKWWTPIFISTEQIAPNQRASFEPTDTVGFWWGRPAVSGVRLRDPGPITKTVDMSGRNRIYFSYDFKSNLWQDSAQTFNFDKVMFD